MQHLRLGRARLLGEAAARTTRGPAATRRASARTSRAPAIRGRRARISSMSARACSASTQADREACRARPRLRQAGDVEGDLQRGHGPRPMRRSDQSCTPASLARATARRAGCTARIRARRRVVRRLAGAPRGAPRSTLEQPQAVARRVVRPRLALPAPARRTAAVCCARIERDRQRHAERAGAQAPVDVLVVEEERLVERPDRLPRAAREAQARTAEIVARAVDVPAESAHELELAAREGDSRRPVDARRRGAPRPRRGNERLHAAGLDEHVVVEQHRVRLLLRRTPGRALRWRRRRSRGCRSAATMLVAARCRPRAPRHRPRCRRARAGRMARPPRGG